MNRPRNLVGVLDPETTQMRWGTAGTEGQGDARIERGVGLRGGVVY